MTLSLEDLANDFARTFVPKPMATRVAVVRYKDDTLHIVRAYMQTSCTQPCGEIVRKENVADGARALPSDIIVACLACGDEPHGTCPKCERYALP
jgi:hypothetical protein